MAGYVFETTTSMLSSLSVCAVLLIQTAVAFTFSKHGSCQSRSMNMVAIAAEKTMQTLEAPDFYWEYRLDRLSQKLGSEVKFSPSNYPDVSGFKDLYDAYYLDLTLQGKIYFTSPPMTYNTTEIKRATILIHLFYL